MDLSICHMWDYQTPLYDIVEGLYNIVKAGKARYIGISNCFAWQLAKADALAEKEGFTKFVSLQGHYNLIFREEEREMAGLAGQKGVSMTEILLAWLLTKAASSVVGATRLRHVEGEAKAVDLTLRDSELAYLEEPYVPHRLVGVMAQNTAAAAKERHVWSTGSQKVSL